MKICSVCQRCYEDNVLSCIEENHHSFEDDRSGGREIISGFRLDLLLESGIAGKTYKATNTESDEPCLIKIMTAPAITDGQKLNQQFLNEAQLIAAVNHPHLVHIYKFGILASGEFYLVTEEVGGQTLRDCLSKVGSPAEITAIQIARQTAEGLEAIHAAGVTHRNINPENIILTSDAEHRLLIKIQNIDFGGINQQITTSEISNSEHKLNNLRYFSPEQCIGQPVDGQADIYSLGIVLYEMLAGEPPFDAPDAAGLIEKQKTTPPPEVKIANFDIRALLTHTLMDSLQKISRLRLKKATAFARQLRHIEQLVTHAPTPPPATSPAHLASRAVTNGKPKTPKVEALPITTNFNESFQVEYDSPIVEMTEVDDLVAIASTNESLALPLEESVDEIVEVENELNLQPELAQPEPVLFEELQADDAPLPSNSLIVEWEQPEDIPSELAVLEARHEEFGDSEFALDLISLDEEPVTLTSEPASRIEIVIENEEAAPEQKSEVPLFATFADSQPPRFPIANQRALMGVGLAALIILAVTVIAVSLINRDSQTVHLTLHPVPISAPEEKLLSESNETEVIPETAETEIALTENSQTEDSKEKTELTVETELSDSQATEAKKRPTLISASSKRSDQPQMAKENSPDKTKPVEVKAEKKPVNNGTIKQKPFENVTIYIKPSPVAAKTDGSIRPRVVQAPGKKRSRLPF